MWVISMVLAKNTSLLRQKIPFPAVYACPLCGGCTRFHWCFEYDGKPLRCSHCGTKLGDVFDSVEWLLKCDKGESVRFVKDFVGISPPAPQAKPKTNKPSFDWKNIIAEYHYTDADGNTIYKVLRDGHKNFMQGRPNPSQMGKWIWNLKDIERVPYQLPMLLDASRCTVYVVEGEKDADNLNRLFQDCGITDCVATTSDGGSNSAKQWQVFVTKYHLADKQVIVMPDNDEPGLEFGRTVCTAFHDAGCHNVKLVTLPVKDVSDLIELRTGIDRTAWEKIRPTIYESTATAQSG